jgi:NADH-quinone oxidoreductase subunit N
VSFTSLLQDVLGEKTLGASLWAFRAELAICATIVALLLVRMVLPRWKSSAFYVMLLGTLAGLYWLIPGSADGSQPPAGSQELFTGMLVSDGFSVFMRGLLLVFALLFATFTQVAGVPEEDDAAEFYVLVLGALLGMCLMVSANHLVIVFLGVEMASVPSYVLAGILRHRRVSTEASLKYCVFGAGAAGVMLYGISLLAGVLGSAHLPTMAARLAELNITGVTPEQTMVLVLGGLMVMVGLAFKLSAVPFHFWAPDVFEGAPAEVGAFLSIASKAAALALLVRLVVGFGHVPLMTEVKFVLTHSAAAADTQEPAAIKSHLLETILAGEDAGQPSSAIGRDAAVAPDGTKANTSASSPTLTEALGPTRQFMCGLISLLAAVTCTFGNLAAYGQTNMKRLLAYSTIAHAGYMMMPVAAVAAVAGTNPEGARNAVAAMGLYLGIYLFMNLGAFAFVAFLRNATGSEQIADYAGLVRRSPGLTVCMTIILFSLVGLPPLAGFAAKFAVFARLFDARLLTLLVIGGLNTVLSLFYYLRVVRVMIISPERAERPAPVIPLWSIPGAYCAVLTVPLLALFVWWDGLYQWVQAATKSLL